MTRWKTRKSEQARAAEPPRASEAALDAALEQTFPASDAVAILEPDGHQKVAPQRAAPVKPKPARSR
jgi:hypothetical protein